VLAKTVGVLLRGTKREDVQRGQVSGQAGSIKPHTQFESEVYVLSKEEGGRHTPFFKGYRPQFYFRTTDVTGSIELPEGVEMVMPGDNIQMNVDPDRSDRHGRRSALRYPRRRPHRRRGRGCQDHQVSASNVACLKGPGNRALSKYRPVVQLVEHRSPKPGVGGSSPSWPAIFTLQGVFVMSAGCGLCRQKLEASGSKLDAVKWVLVAALLVAATLGNQYARRSCLNLAARIAGCGAGVRAGAGACVDNIAGAESFLNSPRNHGQRLSGLFGRARMRRGRPR
jgi:hypothetical protein